ncbi:MAG: 3-dehydroquinate synthase [Bacteroidetes bacterium]|nr:3-dehydroquinate synthase [Bacteroidota bacterium]
MDFIYPSRSELQPHLHALPSDRIIILCDQNTQRACYPKLNVSFPCIVVPPGEASKSFDTLEYVIDQLTALNADRSTLLINLGGGVISDLGGFAASIYLRGIRFINIPTTLMGMVDASLGGKTGINFQILKNYLGTFTHPNQFIVCPDFLDTLPERELVSGYAELIKHALLIGEQELQSVLNIIPQALTPTEWLPIIQRSNQFKWEVVQADFRESGLRKQLNLGHTIGHAIESIMMSTSSPLLHGEAIAVGLWCAIHLSERRTSFDTQLAQSVKTYLKDVFPVLSLEEKVLNQIVELSLKDKKNDQDTRLMVLLSSPGEVVLDVPVSDDEVYSALYAYLNHTT